MKTEKQLVQIGIAFVVACGPMTFGDENGAVNQAAPNIQGPVRVVRAKKAEQPKVVVAKSAANSYDATGPVRNEGAKESESESQLIKDARVYEATLREMADQARDVVQRMPEKPEEMAKNFGEMGQVLVDAKGVLMAILKRRQEIDGYAGTVLQSAAGVRQAFCDLAKSIDDEVEEMRRKPTDNPQAVESASQALLSIKTACQKGEEAVAPLRELVLQTRKQAASLWTELELYPSVFEAAIKCCALYKRGIGEPASYAAVTQGLWTARENLRSIIVAFTQAAEKADEAISKVPTIPFEVPSQGQILLTPRVTVPLRSVQQ